jgi:hypothetical protein
MYRLRAFALVLVPLAAGAAEVPAPRQLQPCAAAVPGDPVYFELEPANDELPPVFEVQLQRREGIAGVSNLLSVIDKVNPEASGPSALYGSDFALDLRVPMSRLVGSRWAWRARIHPRAIAGADSAWSDWCPFQLGNVTLVDGNAEPHRAQELRALPPSHPETMPAVNPPAALEAVAPASGASPKAAPAVAPKKTSKRPRRR